MTYKEIIDRENTNVDSIWLYREGMFMKAYERSAFFAHMYIHEFKLSKRYVKTVNMDVVSLGFPEQTLPKWLYGYVYEQVTDGLVRCQMRAKYDEVKFHNWKDCIVINASDRFTPNTSVIEKTPVYKTAYDLMTQVFAFTRNVSKNVMDPVGKRLKELVYQMCYQLRVVYDVNDPSDNMLRIIDICTEIKFNIQILKDMKEISVNTFALASERVVSVSKQVSLLYQKAKAK